jgi:hypothetical protein
MSGNLLNYTGGVMSMSSILGGGIPGVQHKSTGSSAGAVMDRDSERSHSRLILRKANANNHLSSSLRSPLYYVNSGISKTTPFRAIMSAGDINGSYNQPVSSELRAYNQLSNPRVAGTQNRIGAPKNNGESYYTGNPKYVYDSSDYVRYLKLKSNNKTYDDKADTGSARASSYSFLARVRH